MLWGKAGESCHRPRAHYTWSNYVDYGSHYSNNTASERERHMQAYCTLTGCLPGGWQVVLGRLQMTESLLQRAADDKGSSEAVGDKLVNRAVTLMDSMASMVDR